MEANRWRQIEELYHSALNRAASERQAFLENKCAGDLDLLREVRSLLASDTPTEGLFPTETSPAPFAAGDRAGPYQLESLLGAGGMGAVFRAVDTRLHRTVAVKFLLGGGSDPDQRRRFLHEARAASALNHPNIVAVYDISSERGVDFLVMEYVQGQTLEALIPPEGLPARSVASFGSRIASALAAAHDHGIVHRDVKPANVMVGDDQRVKVLDFGIAKRIEFGRGAGSPAIPGLTAPGMVIGTVSYMSPEQTRGEPLDGRSDIFSLGCVLYRSATGRLPFTGPSRLSVMHAIAAQDPTRPASLRPDLPRELERLISACLEKAPGNRPASAAEAARLLHAISSEGSRAGRVTEPAVARRSVAVIPFCFRTALPEDRFLSVALAEALVHRLSASGELLVRPTTSVLRFAGTDTPWTDVARELNVDLAVEGTIQKSGTRLRVLVEAHRASDLNTLHSSRHDGDVGDLFALQDRIADAVSEALGQRRKAFGEPAVPPTNNPLAYELYMRARDRAVNLNKFDLASAIEMLCRAVELDPDFADAWGQLAHAYSHMGMHLDPNPQWFELGERAVARTLELDPVQCDALCARGQILWSPSRRFQNRPALRAINAALRVNPNRYLARQFRSVILFHLGQYDQARRDAEESLLANPAGYVMGTICLATTAQYRGDYEEAARHFERCIEGDPSHLLANIFRPLPYLYMGRFDRAREIIRQARVMVPEEPQLLANEALIDAFEGEFRKAEDKADEACLATKRSVTHTHHTWHTAASVYALVGQREKALGELRRCAEFGLPNYRLFGSDPALRSLRDHPEFAALLSDLRRQEDDYRPDLELARTSQSG